MPDLCPPIRLLVVDDEPRVRTGLRMRLGVEADCDVVGEAGDGVEALAIARRTAPDVVLMDVEMRGGDGLTATVELRRLQPAPAVVVVSLYDDQGTRQRAADAGAGAFVSKHEADDALLPAIRRAAGRTS